MTESKKKTDILDGQNDGLTEDMTLADDTMPDDELDDEQDGERFGRWEAHWSGRSWSRCSGSWELLCDGKRVDTEIPFQGEPAYTLGTYMSWSFGGSDWCEEWEEYEDGEACGEWCDANREWLSTLAPESEWEDIFHAFQSEDFRRNSCGGCI